MSTYFSHLDDNNGVLLLAFVGGFVDAAGYLKLQGVFTSSITGNLVVASSSVSSSKGALCRSLVCVSFTLAAAVGAMVAFYSRFAHKLKPHTLFILLLSLELVFLVISWILGHYYDDEIDKSDSLDDDIIILISCLMGISMGFQNTAVKEAITSFPATTVMTSTLVNFAYNGSNSLSYYLCTLFASCCGAQSSTKADRANNGSDDPAAEAKKVLAEYVDKQRDFFSKFVGNLKSLLCFTLGALAGAGSIHGISFSSFAVPVGVIVFLIIEIWIKMHENIAAIEKSAPKVVSAAPTVSKEDIQAVPVESERIDKA